MSIQLYFVLGWFSFWLVIALCRSIEEFEAMAIVVVPPIVAILLHVIWS